MFAGGYDMNKDTVVWLAPTIRKAMRFTLLMLRLAS